MTYPVAIFADQIIPGMRIERQYSYSDETKGIALVSQIRQIPATKSMFGYQESSPQVALIGTYEDGKPFGAQCGTHSIWLCHDIKINTKETI